jgi:hypothetical protein
MSDPSVPAPARRRRWPWLFLLLLPVAAWLYLLFASDLRLKRALAETDRLDPGWRLDDIQAARADIPDEENAALTVMAAKAGMPPRWPAWDMTQPSEGDEPTLQQVLRDLRPNEALTPAELAEMREEMARADAAIVEARKLADKPRGRFPIAYTRDYVSTVFPLIQDARGVAYLLSLDALHRAQSGDRDGALVSCRAIVNNARAIGDEPNMIAMLVRMAIRAIAAGHTERALAQGEADPALMAALQKAMEEEAEAPLFLIGLRGERAGNDCFVKSIQDGSTSVRAARGMLTGPGQSAPLVGEESLLYLPGAVTTSRAVLLERMNKVIEISKLPFAEQAAPLAELKESLRHEPLLVREVMPATEKIGLAGRRTQALLLCAAAGLAAEQYRREHGRWPDGLADLKGKFLRDVPTDPFDGKPLRYRPDAEGVIVYSVGQEGKDHGGDRATLNTYKQGTNIGFRLWDKEKRGRARK